MKRTKQILATIISLIILTFFVGTAQAEVCTGSYTIDAIDTSEDIAALSDCTEVSGYLRIGQTTLTSLSGLENLTSVGGHLDISNNVVLTSLSGLDNITSVGGNLVLDSNDALTSLSGLDNITSVGGDLYIWTNDALTSLSGLDNITSVRYLILSGNNALTSLSGLSNITGVVEFLILEYNDVLTSLSGLDNITTVSGDLTIFGNDALTSLSGLDNLTSVGGYLEIELNTALINLCALYNVNLTGESLDVTRNTVLSMDTAYALETQLRNNGFTGTSDIYDNNGTGIVTCDLDNDTVTDAADNCPNTANPNQDDADNDGIGDVCDVDTIYGTISGDVQEGISISIYRSNCGSSTLLDTITTNAEGYYAIGNLENSGYGIYPQPSDYIFSPEAVILQIPQTEIQSYDFTATGKYSISGTVTGDVQEDVSISLYKNECGGDTLLGTVTTDLNGNYIFTGILNGGYTVTPVSTVYTAFSPTSQSVTVSDADITGVDFTATEICDLAEPFFDNGDGTVTDCLTDITWLQNVNCFGYQNWDDAMASAAGLSNGECTLSDGSSEGDWTIPTSNELVVMLLRHFPDGYLAGTIEPPFVDNGEDWHEPSSSSGHVWRTMERWWHEGCGWHVDYGVVYFDGTGLYTTFTGEIQSGMVWPVRNMQ